VIAAARGVAELSPTPTPLRTAKVARAPVIEEQKAWQGRGSILVGGDTFQSHLSRVPYLVGEVIFADTVRIASGKKNFLHTPYMDALWVAVVTSG